MKTKSIIAALLIISLTLVGCAHNDLGSPCADFGRQCHKEQVN